MQCGHQVPEKSSSTSLPECWRNSQGCPSGSYRAKFTSRLPDMSQEGTGLGVECRMDEPPPGLLGTGSSSSGLGPGTETRGAGRASGPRSRPVMFFGLWLAPIVVVGKAGAVTSLPVLGLMYGVAVVTCSPRLT